MKPVIPFIVVYLKDAWGYHCPKGDYKDIIEELHAGWWVDLYNNRIERVEMEEIVWAKSKNDAIQLFDKGHHLKDKTGNETTIGMVIIEVKRNKLMQSVQKFNRILKQIANRQYLEGEKS